MTLTNVWHRVSAVDNSLCLLVNRMANQRILARFFLFVSRIGDGIFWYSLMLALPFIYGVEGIYAAVVMAFVGVINLFLYKQCKGSINRERPYVSIAPIQLIGVPLDRYSFPSGHTLHAVGFTTIATAFFPGLWVVLYPVAFLVALSRPLLGLHYPSDVLVAAAIGYGVAHVTLQLLPL